MKIVGHLSELEKTARSIHIKAPGIFSEPIHEEHVSENSLVPGREVAGSWIIEIRVGRNAIFEPLVTKV